MAISLQVLYPISDGATFDYDYYVSKHIPLVGKIFGEHGMTSMGASKGVSGGPVPEPGYFAIATMMFPDEASLGAAMEAGGEIFADIPNYTSVQPDVLVGVPL